jgi:acyl-coenzyme A thioesterase PaaI-like protein
VADDFREVVVTMSPRFYNRNAFGAHFGGSLAAMTDPFFALMLIRILGPDYHVIDAETRLRFLAQARGRVEARFVIDDAVLEQIRTATVSGDKHFVTLEVPIEDESGSIVVAVEKTIYVRLRRELRPQREP